MDDWGQEAMDVGETDDELHVGQVDEILTPAKQPPLKRNASNATWGSGGGGEDPCPWCDGTGRSEGIQCAECEGTGREVVDAGAGDVWRFGSQDVGSGEEDPDDEKLDELGEYTGPEGPGRYVQLQPADLDERRRRLADDLRDQLALSPDETDCILRAGLWNVDSITNEWINNPATVREKFGIAGPSERKPAASAAAAAAAGGAPVAIAATVECMNPMCDNDQSVPADEARALGCGHLFCDDCWRMHLYAQVKSGPGSVFAPCMGFDCKKKGCRHEPEDGCKCQLLIPERWFVELLVGPGMVELRQKWQHWTREKFVEASKDLQFCPSPDCDIIIADVDGHGSPAQCPCGHRFCFKCRLDDHLPVPCDLARRFLALDSTDALTESLIAATTKPCPSCKAPTERNLACIHMTCSNCKHDYCWICLDRWRGHQGGYYSCSKYNEQKRSGTLTAEQQSLIDNRDLLSKYQVHRSLHDKARKEIKHLSELRQNIDRDDTSFDSKRYLYRVIGQLQDGLRLIQWSHCLTYFVQAGPAKRLFEFQQESLIELCRKLLRLMDQLTVAEMCESRNRVQINNEASIVENQRLKTIDSLEKGQLIESIQNEADRHSESWACGKCSSVFPVSLGLDKCARCKACKLHADVMCWACFPR